MDSETALELGIFSRTFDRPSLGEVLDAVVANGFRLVHFSFRSVGLPALPARLTADQCAAVRREVDARGLRIAGVSATFNAIHPDPVRRDLETSLASSLVRLAPTLGTALVSLSTGTRDPVDMWRGHPANEEPSAWVDLRATLARLLAAAREANVTLGIEPEHNNVISSAVRARRLLDEVGDRHLKIILDPANLVTPATAARQRRILGDAFGLLAPDVVVFHAKDFSEGGDTAAGRGLLDYDVYFDLVAQHRIVAPVILHEVEEDDVGRAREFVLRSARAVRAARMAGPRGGGARH